MSAPPLRLWVAHGAAKQAAFAAAATAFLMRDEARHNLQLAVLADAVRGRYPTAHLVAVRRAAGALRLATEADRAPASTWFDAFALEALHRADDSDDALFASFVDDPVRRLYLWTMPAGTVVSMVGRSGHTPTGVRIGPVYTPPEHRGRGYGEALVAAVSQRVLDEGARACYLYTDLDYGASNRLYLRIGYAQVGEAAEMGFEAPLW